MKTIIVTFLALLSFSSLTWAQEKANTAISQSKIELKASKENGNYTFVLPIGVNSEEVQKNSKFYTHYFTVDYLENTREAKIKMISNDPKSRNVIIRFLASCGVQNVLVDGTNLNLTDFFHNHIQ